MLENVNGCAIHYEIRQNNKTNAVPVLFLHGWGCDMYFFSGTMEAMQEKATLIALDFPAHGKSEEPPEPWGVKEYACQVKRLLENHQIEKVDIVAHSFGGRIAIWLAANEPQMVDKIVITGGSGLKKPATEEAVRRTGHYKKLKAAAQCIAKVPLLKQPMKHVLEMLVQKYGSEDYVKLSDLMRVSFVKIVSEDLTPMLTRITAPVLLIWGSEDRQTPLWMGQTMEHDIADAGLVVFQGRTHYAFLEENARFNLIVKQYFWGGNAE